jgi:hypothetical protein
MCTFLPRRKMATRDPKAAMVPDNINRPAKGSRPKLEVSIEVVREVQLEEESNSSNWRNSPLSITLRVASEMSKARGEPFGNT